MSKVISLNNLQIGKSAKVYELRGSMNGRMQECGLIEGTRIKAVQKSPFGDPTAYLFRGLVIALREIDAKNVLVICDG